MSDTHLMEDRVVERVARRVGPHQNGGLLSAAPRFLKSSTRPAEPEASEPTADAAPPPAPVPESTVARPGWLLLEFIQEIRTAARMFTDYRYRLSWTGRVVPIACIVFALMSFFVFRIVPIIGM